MSATRKRGLRIDDAIAAAVQPSPAVTNPPGTEPAGSLEQGRLRELPVDEIHPNPDQPRKRFDEPALAALTQARSSSR
jgi:hypothetical protein